MTESKSCALERFVADLRESRPDEFQRLAEKLLNSLSAPTSSGCLEYTKARTRAGYGRLCIGTESIYAHRAAVILSGRNIPPGGVVMHLCDNPSCCAPDHLRVGTVSENAADMARKRRSTIGERNPRAKLAAELVREIRASKHGCRVLAKSLGLSKSCVADIRAGRRWGRVE